jgi:hypothetical protein
MESRCDIGIQNSYLPQNIYTLKEYVIQQVIYGESARPNFT